MAVDLSSYYEKLNQSKESISRTAANFRSSQADFEVKRAALDEVKQYNLDIATKVSDLGSEFNGIYDKLTDMSKAIESAGHYHNLNLNKLDLAGISSSKLAE